MLPLIGSFARFVFEDTQQHSKACNISKGRARRISWTSAKLMILVSRQSSHQVHTARSAKRSILQACAHKLPSGFEIQHPSVSPSWGWNNPAEPTDTTIMDPNLPSAFCIPHSEGTKVRRRSTPPTRNHSIFPLRGTTWYYSFLWAASYWSNESPSWISP